MYRIEVFNMTASFKGFFKDVKLQCSRCGKEINENDEMTVAIRMPNKRRMPVGPLDRVLSKFAHEILCTKCK